MNAKDLIKFDERTHTYTNIRTGQVVPGVTSIINPVMGQDFSMVDAEVLQRASLLGQLVHDMISRDIRSKMKLSANQLCNDNLVLFDYFDGWREFILRSGFEPILTEELVYSARYGYAGRLDLFGRLNGRLLLPDIKRVNQVSRLAGVQTAAYRGALIETFPEYADEKIDRCVLHLRPGAKWQLVPFTDGSDYKVFLSALNIHNWKKAA